MRQKKLSADQAAVLTISDTFSRIDEHMWTSLQAQQPELAADLGRLVLGCAALAASKPETFASVFVKPSFDLANYFSNDAR